MLKVVLCVLVAASCGVRGETCVAETACTGSAMHFDVTATAAGPIALAAGAFELPLTTDAAWDARGGGVHLRRRGASA